MASKHADLQKDLDIIKGNEDNPGARGPNSARIQMKVKKSKKKSLVGEAENADSGAEKLALASSIRRKIAKKRRRTDSSSSTKSSEMNKSLGKIKLPGRPNGVEKQSVSKNTPPPKKQGPRSRGSIDPNAIPIEAIKFTVGYRIEAVDHGQWYKAKIVEVDTNKGEILVHFDGWGAKFDTWYPMTSALIRGRTQIQKKEDEIVFNEGEDVLARWTDGNFYPATVITVKESGSCVVMYFDGMKKLIRPNVMKKMSEKAKEIATEAANKLLLHPIDIPIGTPPRSDDNGKPNYRTSANDRERRVAARRGRVSDSGSVDSSPVKSTASTPKPVNTTINSTPSSASSSTKKRGRPRKSSSNTVPEKMIKLDQNAHIKDNKNSNNIPEKKKEIISNQKNTSNILKQDNKQNGKNTSTSPEKDKKSLTESSTEEDRDVKVSRLDNIISKIGPTPQEKNKKSTTPQHLDTRRLKTRCFVEITKKIDIRGDPLQEQCTVCKAHSKRKKTKYYCSDCKVHLCIPLCFKRFHTMQIF